MDTGKVLGILGLLAVGVVVGFIGNEKLNKHADKLVAKLEILSGVRKPPRTIDVTAEAVV